MLIISFTDSANIFYALSIESRWQPDRRAWEKIKENSKEVNASITILGLDKKDFFSWNSFPRSGILPETRGLFGKMSPSSRYVVASVNEISLALITNNPGFSQVFFPTYGILAYYSTRDKVFKPLPGANDYAYVQANPNWHHDEKYIVYARAKNNRV